MKYHMKPCSIKFDLKSITRKVTDSLTAAYMKILHIYKSGKSGWWVGMAGGGGSIAQGQRRYIYPTVLTYNIPPATLMTQ